MSLLITACQEDCAQLILVDIATTFTAVLPRHAAARSATSNHGAAALAGAPLQTGGRPLGLLTVSRQVNLSSLSDTMARHTFSHQCSTAAHFAVKLNRCPCRRL